MSFYDDASLVVIPSGYKTSKVYSVKPTDGTGDLTFTRTGDTATRVGPDGLIEKVRTNLVLQSQTFDNASWVKYNSSVTANSTTAPDGTSTADTLVDNTANDIHVTYQSIALSAGEHTISCYAKANTLSHLSIYIFDGTNFFSSGIFNLSNGTVSGAGSIVSAGNGWYRVSFTATIGSGSGNVYIALSNGSTISYVGSGQSIYIWGYQVEAGVATDYIATTTAAVSVGPVANVPRLDYLNSSCGRLILEPQRTSLVTFSEQMDNAAWTKVQSSITANNGVSPDGYANADKFIANTTSNIHFANSAISDTAASWTYSLFAKAAGYDRLIMWTAATNFVGFNLTTGVVESTLGTGVTSANIQNYGNGWYRCSITSTSISSGTSVAFAVFNAAYTNGNVNPIFTGNGTDGILVYGAQFEAGAYATSYIPTLGAAVTRGADLTKKTSASDLIGQTEGTIFGEFEFPNVNIAGASSYFGITDGSFSNCVLIGREPSGAPAKYFFYINANGSNVLNNAANNVQSGTAKLAIAYKSGSWAAYLNGSLVASNTTTFSFGASLNQLAIGPNDSAMTTQAEIMLAKQALLFKTRLTNAQLAELTTI